MKVHSYCPSNCISFSSRILLSTGNLFVFASKQIPKSREMKSFKTNIEMYWGNLRLLISPKKLYSTSKVAWSRYTVYSHIFIKKYLQKVIWDTKHKKIYNDDIWKMFFPKSDSSCQLLLRHWKSSACKHSRIAYLWESAYIAKICIEEGPNLRKCMRQDLICEKRGRTKLPCLFQKRDRA
jgi:hypothetical protein